MGYFSLLQPARRCRYSKLWRPMHISQQMLQSKDAANARKERTRNYFQLWLIFKQS